MTSSENVLSQLHADHREIQALLHSFSAEKSPFVRRHLLSRLTKAIRLHCALESGVFVPAVAEVTGNAELLEETGTAFAGVTAILNELGTTHGVPNPSPSLVTELQAFINNHISAAEADGGILAGASRLKIDWAAIERALNLRRAELSFSYR